MLIDLESGWHMLRREEPVHTFLHTYLGASLIIAPAAALTWATILLGRRLRLFYREPPRLVAVVVGAIAGAWSHVAFDSIMHSDVEPFAPWSESNPFYQAGSLATLHGFCLVAGAIGGVIYWLRLAKRRHR